MGKLSTLEMSREDWLKSRKMGIGSSDVGAILGLNKYKTPLQVYQDKIAEEIIEEPMNPAMEFGLKLEQVVADTYAERTGRKVIRDNKIRFSSELPFLLCNLDRVILPENGEGRGILEIKTASGFAAKGWETEIPLSYYAQIQHQLFITGWTWGEFALLFDGRDFRTFPVKRDDEYIAKQNELLTKFWNENVLLGIPPAMTAADAELIQAQVGSIIEATPQIVAAYEVLRSVNADYSRIKKQKEEAENEIKGFMAGNEALNYRGQTLATWKNAKPSVKIDEKRLASEMPKVFEQFKIEKQSRRFNLKGGGDNE